jgi:hypothetical protein
MRAIVLGPGAVVVLGATLRALPVVGAGFPLNDGGLFLTMGDEVRNAGFVLPLTTDYNGLDAPFAYPPFAFYLLAALETLGLDGVDLLRWVPLLFSIATIPVVYLIGREIFQGSSMALGTAAFFAVSTGSYEWLVMGGGITRAPGLFFALIAVLLAIRAYRSSNWWLGVGAGVALGFTALSHPQSAVFGVVSVVLLLPFVASNWRVALPLLGVILGISAIVVVPWLTLVVSRHGIDPFLSAVGTGGSPFIGLVNLLVARTSGGQLEILGIATLIGAAVSALRGFWVAPVWLLAVLVIDSRAGNVYASVPAAMAVTFMVRDLGSIVGRRWPGLGNRAPVTIGILLVAVCFADSVAAQRAPDSPTRALTDAARGAMSWAADQTDADAAFVVVSGNHWAADAEAEWFPVLANRRSLATVQGYEWLGADQFRQQVERSSILPVCVVRGDLDCIDSWLSDAGKVDYLFLTASREAEARGLECCLQMAEQVARLRPSETVYESEGVLVVHLP